MKEISLIAIVLTALVLLGCQNQVISEAELSETTQKKDSPPPMVEMLPKEIAGFKYYGFHEFPEPLGYSLRYTDAKDSRVFVDVYFYPVPESLLSSSNEEKVIEATRGALQEIDQVTKKGKWDSFVVEKSYSLDFQGTFGSMVEVQLSTNNRLLYSLLYVFEFQGSYVKFRMTMPDIDRYRSSERWLAFVDFVVTKAWQAEN